MKSLYTFVIIDLHTQWFDKFDLKHPEQYTVSIECCNKVKQAIKDDAHIICIESNISSLSKLLSGYNKSYIINKESRYGADQVSNLIDQYNMSKDIYVGGIYRDACVYMLVKNLAEIRSDLSIKIISNCVSNLHLRLLPNHDTILNDLPNRISNVSII